ncbi:MAG: ATP-binding protein [Ruthenibacterium sp.]
MSERELSRAVSVERSIIKKYKKTIWHRFIGACKDYALIKPGDAIAVCISGGKDSFLLAKCMQQLQKHSDVPFTLQFLCMDPGYRPENRAAIEQNAALLGLALHIFETDIFDTVAEQTHAPCYLCARMRRGYLYKNAQALGCNKIALGHHFDDVIETALMSMLWGAEIKTMLPKLHSTNYVGMELIRPLYLVRETDIKAWQRYNDLQFLRCACRFTERDPAHENTGARAATKALITQLRTQNPQADYNLFRSLHSVNLNMLPGYTKNGRSHSFLDEYDTVCDAAAENAQNFTEPE